VHDLRRPRAGHRASHRRRRDRDQRRRRRVRVRQSHSDRRRRRIREPRSTLSSTWRTARHRAAPPSKAPVASVSMAHLRFPSARRYPTRGTPSATTNVRSVVGVEPLRRALGTTNMNVSRRNSATVTAASGPAFVWSPSRRHCHARTPAPARDLGRCRARPRRHACPVPSLRAAAPIFVIRRRGNARRWRLATGLVSGLCRPRA
jgi:hypothetical protein